MMNTNQNWNASLYDSNHQFVSDKGQSLVDFLSPVEGHNILDLGCGTGDLAMVLTSRGARVTAIDASKDMIDAAIDKYPSINFMVMDASQMAFDHTFNSVFSNAVLHWLINPRPALEKVLAHLEPGGKFVTEFGARGNCHQILTTLFQVMDHEGYAFEPSAFPWYFPTVGEFTCLLEDLGFHVDYAVAFDRPTPLKGPNGLKHWLSMFAGKLLEHIPESHLETIIHKTEKALRPAIYRQGCWYADYRRIRVIAHKPNH